MAEAFLDINSENVYENEVRESQLIDYLDQHNFSLINKAVDANYADFTFQNNNK